MAVKRMFSKRVIDTDEFINMPHEAQVLYFHMSMNADDDGFVYPKKIMRMIGAREDSLKTLIAKRFIIPFESGVIVIRHWRINNYLRNDRYKPTEFQRELKSLSLVDDAYEEKDNLPIGIPNGNQMSTSDIDIDLDIEKDKEKDNSSNDSLSLCSETSSEIFELEELEPPKEEPIFINMPLRNVDKNGNTEEIGIPLSWVEEMEKLYPELDVKSEVRKAVAWCINNPKDRKTKRGWQRFLNGWLTTAIDRKTRYPNSYNTQKSGVRDIDHSEWDGVPRLEEL